MSLVKWTLIGVILLPGAEIATFVVLALTIGWLWTALLLVGTTAAGVLVLRHTGRGDLRRVRTALSTGGFRAIHLDTPGLAPLIAGILLVLPGFITDLMGALLLVPPLRRWVRAAIGRALKKRQAERDPSVVDLTPNEWHQVPDAIEDRRNRKPASQPTRKRRPKNTLS